MIPNLSGFKRLVPIAMTKLKFVDVLISSINNENGLEKFKNKMKIYLDKKYSCTYTSFMRGIFDVLVYLKSNNPEKDSIILPRYSCPSFIHAIKTSKLKALYCDVDTKTLNLNLKSIPNYNPNKVLAIICVNHFGLSNSMENLSNFCHKNEISLIEDLGYSLGTVFNYKKLGNYGLFSILNFKEGKGLPIGGSMVLTNEKDFHYWSEGRVKARHKKKTLFFYPFVVNPHIYYFVRNFFALIKVNYRRKFTMEDTLLDTKTEDEYTFDNSQELQEISNFQGQLGLCLMNTFDNQLQIRYTNSKRIREIVNKSKFATNIELTKGTTINNFIRYPILVNTRKRFEVCERLLNLGIEARNPYPEVEPEKNLYPNSYEVSKSLLTIPTNCNMRINDFNNIREVFVDV